VLLAELLAELVAELFEVLFEVLTGPVSWQVHRSSGSAQAAPKTSDRGPHSDAVQASWARGNRRRGHRPEGRGTGAGCGGVRARSGRRSWRWSWVFSIVARLRSSASLAGLMAVVVLPTTPAWVASAETCVCEERCWRWAGAQVWASAHDS